MIGIQNNARGLSCRDLAKVQAAVTLIDHHGNHPASVKVCTAFCVGEQAVCTCVG